MTTFTTTAYGWFENESVDPTDISEAQIYEVGFVGTNDLQMSYEYTYEDEDWPFVEFSIEQGQLYNVVIDGEIYSLLEAYSSFATVSLENGDTIDFATVRYGDYESESYVFLIPLAGDYSTYFNENFDLDALENVRSLVDFEDYLFSGTFAEGATFSLLDLPEIAVSQDDYIADFPGYDYIVSGDGDDEIYGLSGNDTIKSGAGDDYLVPGQGRDKILGGAGFDQVSYNESDGVTQGVKVNLAKGFAIDNWGDRDTVKQVEAVRGSSLDDTLIGNKQNNFFRGLEGDDTIKGGNGSDQVRYDRDARYGGEDGVTVNLAKGFAIDGFGDRDKLVSIERVLGSDYNDKLIGNKGNNTLSGLDGRDVILGGSGADTIEGGAGNDKLKGQGGNDVFIFDLDSGRDKVLGFKTGSDVFDLTEADIAFDELSFEQSGKFVLVEFEDVDILVRGSSLSDLNDADNFIF